MNLLFIPLEIISRRSAWIISWSNSRGNFNTTREFLMGFTFLVLILLSPYTVLAAAVDFNDTTLILPSDGSTYNLKTANVTSLDVSGNNFTFVVPGGGSLELTSLDKKKFDNDQSVTSECRTNDSFISFSVDSGQASKTIKITPGSACTIVSTSSGGGSPSIGSSGGGGGGGGSTASTLPSQTVEKVTGLKQQITALQAKIAQKLALGPQVPRKFGAVPPAFGVFVKNLSPGQRGEEVKRLQELLSQDKEIYPEGLTTGFYGPQTLKAVRRFQLKYGVIKNESDSGNGLVGPKTIAKLSEVFGKATPAPNLVPGPAPAPITAPAPAPSAMPESERQTLITTIKDKIQEFTAKLLQLQVKLLQEKINALKK